MRSLFLFFLRYYTFFLFILLESFAVLLMAENKSFHRSGLLNASNEITGNIYLAYSYLTGYLRLHSANERLADENAELRSQLEHYRLSGRVRSSGPPELDFPQNVTYIPATVINNSVTRTNNYLTLNKGSRSGIRPRMGVVNDEGIVGIIKDVSENFSTVISLLHQDMQVSAHIPECGNFGVLRWDVGSLNTAILSDVPKNAVFHIGSLIMTTGYSHYFPAGIPIGTITSFSIAEGTNFFKVEVQLFTHFESLENVYVISSLKMEERHTLEKLMENEF